jgi:hypothetical protein
LLPGDVIVLEVPDDLMSDEDYAQLSASVGRVWPTHKVLLLVGCTLRVVGEVGACAIMASAASQPTPHNQGAA